MLDLVSSLHTLADAERLAERRRIFGDLHQVEGSANDLLHLARQLVASGHPRPRLYQCYGLDDPLYDNNVRARDAFRSLGLELTYEEGPGAHEWGYWDQQIQRVLAWLPLARST